MAYPCTFVGAESAASRVCVAGPPPGARVWAPVTTPGMSRAMSRAEVASMPATLTSRTFGVTGVVST